MSLPQFLAIAAVVAFGLLGAVVAGLYLRHSGPDGWLNPYRDDRS